MTSAGLLGVFKTLGEADTASALRDFSRSELDATSSRGFCGGPLLLNLSYSMPEYFPFPPIQLVMERIPRTCDLYKQRNFCNQFSESKEFEPEYHVREVFASFLSGCHLRSCMTLDLGANNGWFTAYALSLGSRAIAVEPQGDLAKAIAQTIELNCWTGRGIVLNAFATPIEPDKRPVLWRASSARSRNLQLGSSIPLEILLSQQVFELVKMDADGPEGMWLEIVDRMLSQGQVDVRTIVLECNDCTTEIVRRFQQHHGYDIYLLDMHVDARFLNSKGIDAYSYLPEKLLPSILEELYSIRFMRHVYRFKANVTDDDLKACWAATRPFSNQYVFTKVTLLEPRHEHPLARMQAKNDEELMKHQRALENLGDAVKCYQIWAGVTTLHHLYSVTMKYIKEADTIWRSRGANFGTALRRCGDPRGTLICFCLNSPCSWSEDTCWSDYCDVERRESCYGDDALFEGLKHR